MNEQEKQELYKAFVECFGKKTCKDKGSGKYVVYWGSFGDPPEFYYDVVQYVWEFNYILEAIKQYNLDIKWGKPNEQGDKTYVVFGYSNLDNTCVRIIEGSDLDLLVMQAVVAINKYNKEHYYVAA